MGGGYFYRTLNKDILEINKVFISLFGVGIILIAIFVGMSITKCSYALFSDTIVGEKTIEVEIHHVFSQYLIAKSGSGGLEKIFHAGDENLQIPYNEDVVEYRFRGKAPNNYVSFNNELWRIIGVFPTDDGTGKIENRVKLVRNVSIGRMLWDTNGTNNWVNASLNDYINDYYYGTLTEEAKNMIGDTKYYLGGFNSSDLTTSTMFSYERRVSGTTYYQYAVTNHVNKMALMYASDYGYAATSCENKKFTSSVGDDLRVCRDDNWMYRNSEYGEWLLNQYTRYLLTVHTIYSEGFLNSSNVNGNLHITRPVLSLKYDVVRTSGSGTY